MTAFRYGNARLNPCNHHALGLFALGPEKLLAVNLVIGGCFLAFVRNEPVDELLAKLLLHMRMLGRVNQDDTVRSASARPHRRTVSRMGAGLSNAADVSGRASPNTAHGGGT